MKKEMDLLQILSILRKKLLIIALSTVIVGLLAYIASAYIIEPQYSATASMYVYNSSTRNDDITSTDLTTSQKLVQTYIVILKSNSVLSDVAEQLGGIYTTDEIRKMLSANTIDDTEAFSVTVTNGDPEIAQKIVNTIVDIAPKEIIRVVKAGAVEVIDTAVLPAEPSSPNIVKNTAVGAVIGLILSIFIAILSAMFDTVIHSEEDIASTFNIPILGVIPSINTNEHGRTYRYASKT